MRIRSYKQHEGDKGFQVLDKGNVVASFFWHEGDEERHTYAQALAALPDRLTEMGYEDQVTDVLGKVVNQFGAG